MNNELKGIWKEILVAYFKVLSWNLSGGTEENHKNLQMASLRAKI
jgi:hypothetical protein